MKKTIFLFAITLFSVGLYSFNKLQSDDTSRQVSVPPSNRLQVNAGDDEIFDPTGIVAPNAGLEKLGEGYSFTEGPAVDKEGNVFFTDQPNDKIIKWSANNGALSTFLDNSGGRSNGMYFDAAGDLITCADMKGEIWRIDKNGHHSVVVNQYEGKLLNGPNDLWINPITGGMYITDPRYVRDYWDTADPRRQASQQGGAFLYYLGPRRKKLKRVDENLVVPNGIVGSPDGKKLYLGNIDPKVTYVYDIKKDGSLTNRQIFCTMQTDGMTTDEQGNVYLTNHLGVTGFNKNGERIFNVPTGEGWTANVVFGGVNGKTLFITAMGRVYGLKMNVKGAVK